MIMDQLFVFLSSPGDVSRERQLAREVLDQIQSERLYRDRLKLEVVAWDKPGAGAAMPAHLTPQEAIDRGLRKPSQCDIVIVIFWARMGTPLSAKYTKPGGGHYRSGTEYEFLDALHAARQNGKPDVLVYRRQKPPDVNLADPERKEKEQQWEQVERFFDEFRNPDGSFRRYYKAYAKPSDFKEVLTQDLRDLLAAYLESHFSDKADGAGIIQEVIWKEPPFPGLRPFTPEESLIYFGRDREIDQLIEMLDDSQRRFIAVVGASGSGKSSLVAAGLLPALAKKALPGSQDWAWLRFTPAEVGDNPFMALAGAFKPILEKHGRLPREMAAEITADASQAAEYFAMALAGRPPWAELLLFIDQFEEFFTLVDPKYRQGFVDLLAQAAEADRVRAVVTMRSDFYHRCLDWPVLNFLLARGHYPLLPPDIGALHDMIALPAEQAGLQFEEGLASRILGDTGTDPGALALMAFALHELWKLSQDRDGSLCHADYESFDGVHGAIGKQAEATFCGIAGEKAVLERSLSDVFRELVEIDETGLPTRRRALKRQISKDPAAITLVEELTHARLLVTSRGQEKGPIVEVAHEAIFKNWPRLNTWIKEFGDDLYLRRQVRRAADRWEKDGQDRKYIWPDERVMDVVGMMARFKLGVEDFTDIERSFLGPIDRQVMLAELENSNTSHDMRALIGRRLALMGDSRPGVGLRPDNLPDLEWCQVPGGEVKIDIERKGGRMRFWGGHRAETFQVAPFFIAKYPITWSQYRVFLEAEDGFHNPQWWKGLLFQVDTPGRLINPFDNHPAVDMCWLEAVAFCRWLTAHLGYEVRLPTEWQWQQAATGGESDRVYPWGADWDADRANTLESGINQTTAVGLYPHGISPVGALDMSGNVWEWCLNEYEKPTRMKLGGEASRVVRGGSWYNVQHFARAGHRGNNHPNGRNSLLGFRLSCASPI
jgi:formylglycine-generating enzyme required for sulfatase activity